MSSYDASLCGLPQQPSKGDNRRHAGAVEEEEGGHALEAHSILKVTQVEWSFPLDVLYQPPKQPDHSTDTRRDLRFTIDTRNIISKFTFNGGDP